MRVVKAILKPDAWQCCLRRIRLEKFRLGFKKTSFKFLFRFDLKKALESSKNLPSFAQKSVDVDALEAR